MERRVEVGSDSALVASYFAALGRVLDRLPLADIERAIATIRGAWATGKTLFLLGNGGSAATASHLTVDLSKGLAKGDRPRMRVIALTDNVPLLTAYGNDVGYDCVFREQLANFVEPGDVVLALSGSGNSPNVLQAIQLANERQAVTIGITGFQGGKLQPLAQQAIVVPCDNMQLIEDAHMAVAHVIFAALRDGPDPRDA